MKLHELQAQGGPAFPTHQLEWDFGSDSRELATKHPGMSLRDYFVAKAMAVVTPPRDLCGTAETAREYAEWAEKCLRMADALLKAREQ